METRLASLQEDIKHAIYSPEGTAKMEVLDFFVLDLDDKTIDEALETLPKEELVVYLREAMKRSSRRDRSNKRLRQAKFGESTEQLSLFDDIDQEIMDALYNATPAEDEIIVIKEHKRRKRRRTTSRPLKEIKKALVPEDIHHYPDGVDPTDPNWVEIGTEVKEEVTVVRYLKNTRHILHYGKMKNQPEVVDQSPILRAHYAKLAEGTLLSPSLAADMIFMRYRMVQPVTKVMFLYREMNFDVCEQTLRNWYSTILWDLIFVLYNFILETARGLHYIHIDETFLKVMESVRKGLGKRDNIVGIVSAKYEEIQLVLFAYSENRKDGFLVPILGEYFHGHMMSDGLVGYELYLADSKGNCLLHWRRMFVKIIKDRQKLVDEYEALETTEERIAWAMDPLNRSTFLALRILYCIGEIYYLEEGIDDLEVLAVVREKECPRFVDQIFADSMELELGAKEGSELFKAAHYGNTRKEELSYFLKDPRAPKDNNRIEVQFRRISQFRHSSFKIETVKGAKELAMAQTICASAEINGLYVGAYLHFIFFMMQGRRLTDELMEMIAPFSLWLPENLFDKNSVYYNAEHVEKARALQAQAREMGTYPPELQAYLDALQTGTFNGFQTIFNQSQNALPAPVKEQQPASNTPACPLLPMPKNKD